MFDKKFVGLAVALACGLAAPSALAQGGDGGGVSGPNLSGPSIPIHSDKEIAVQQVLAAEDTCRREMVQMLYAQSHPTFDLGSLKYEGWRGQKLTPVTWGVSAFTSRTFKYYEVTGYSVPIHETQGLLGLTYVGDEKAQSGRLILDVVVNPRFSVLEEAPENAIKNRTLAELEAKVSLPAFSYESVDTDFEYNDFEMEIGHRTVARNLVLRQPEVIEETVNFVNYRNSGKARVSKIRISPLEYRDCLLREVQNPSRTEKQ